MDAVNLSNEELAENSNGGISSNQRATLRGNRVAAIINAILLALIGIGLVLVLMIKLINPSFAGRGEFLIGLPIGLLWVWLLRTSPSRWRRINLDIQEGRVSQIEGRVGCETQGNIGIIQMPHYLIRVAEKTFRTTREVYFQFKHQEYYRMFYTPFSETLLGGVRIPDPTFPSVDEPEVNFDLETISPQELELLKLISAGLSNKQIASNLWLSVNTVKMYTSKLYRKLRAHSRTEAIALARRAKIL